MVIKVTIIYKTEGVCGVLGAIQEDSNMGEGEGRVSLLVLASCLSPTRVPRTWQIKIS